MTPWLRRCWLINVHGHRGSSFVASQIVGLRLLLRWVCGGGSRRHIVSRRRRELCLFRYLGTFVGLGEVVIAILTKTPSEPLAHRSLLSFWQCLSLWKKTCMEPQCGIISVYQAALAIKGSQGSKHCVSLFISAHATSRSRRRLQRTEKLLRRR